MASEEIKVATFKRHIFKTYKKRWLIFGGALLLLIILGGIYWYEFVYFIPPKVTKHQYTMAQNNIAGQLQSIQQEQQSGYPNSVLSPEYDNLAEEYASTGQCSQARSALSTALKLSSSQNISSEQQALQTVNQFCRPG